MNCAEFEENLRLKAMYYCEKVSENFINSKAKVLGHFKSWEAPSW